MIDAGLARSAPGESVRQQGGAADGFLQNLHLWGAAVGIAMQPISTATGNIGLGIAVASMMPRAPRLTAELRELTQQAWLRLLLMWLAWSWLSLAWSPDRSFGIEQFRATRVLLWIPVLWPIRNEWRLLSGAILAGAAAMALVQACQVRYGWPEPKYGVGSGWTTPTQTGLWAAVALSFWLILIVSLRARQAILALPITMLTGLSLVWSATRASALGLIIEILISNLVLCLTTGGWLRRAASRAIIGLLILGGAWMWAGSTLEIKFKQAAREATETMAGRVAITSEERLTMWIGALRGWRQQPVFGTGIGGVPSIMRQTEVRHTVTDMRSVTMIHSTYVQALVETGLVGLTLLIASIGMLFRDVLRGLRGQPHLVANFGALIIWIIAAGFDSYQQSGGFLSVGAILMPLSLARRRRSSAPHSLSPDGDDQTQLARPSSSE